MPDSAAERRTALRGRSGLDGGLHIAGSRAVHTMGVRFSVEAAFLSADLTVLRVTQLKPWRVALGGPSARSVVQTQAGSFERWGVRVGDQLEVREAG